MPSLFVSTALESNCESTSDMLIWEALGSEYSLTFAGSNRAYCTVCVLTRVHFTHSSNRYPGLGCDIPSHAYTFSWAPWHGWQRFLAPGADCLRYVNRCAELAGLREYACFSTNVVSAVWDEGDAMWKVELEDIKTGRRFTDEARVLVNGE